MSKVQELQSRMGTALARQRENARRGVDMMEVLGGSFVSGYVAEQYPEVAGVPTDAGLALVMLTAGMSMKQRDLLALGLGFGSGYMRDKGREAARSMPLGNVLPFANGG